MKNYPCFNAIRSRIGSQSLIALILIIFGCYARWRGVLSSDLWEDELWRANQISGSTSYWQLLQGNHEGQEAPVQLSEWLVGRLGLLLFGQTDFAYRIWSCLFACFAILAFWLLLQELVSKSWALIGLAFFAINPGMIEHSQEFKPYSLDVLLALLCFYLFLIEERDGWRNWKRYIAFLTFFALFSNSFLFFTFVIPVAYWRIRQHTKTAQTKLLFSMSLPILAYLSFYTLHSIALRNKNIFRFWQPQTLTSWPRADKLFSLELPNVLEWYTLYPIPFRTISVYFSWALFVVLIAVVPFISYRVISYRRRQWAGAFIAIPLILQFALSSLGMFPLFQRVSAFYYPILTVSLCILLDYVFNLVSCSALGARSTQQVSLLCIVPLLFLQLYYGAPKSDCCMKHGGKIEGLIRNLEEHASDDDVIYASSKAFMALEHYKFHPKARVTVEDDHLPTIRYQDPNSSDRLATFFKTKFEASRPSSVWLLSLESKIDQSIEAYKRYFLSMEYDFEAVNSGQRTVLVHARRRATNSTNVIRTGVLDLGRSNP